MAVKEDNIPVYRASKIYGVPLTTLRDRVDSRVSVDSVKNGPAPLLSLSEEQLLVEHVKGLARVGYGYTRAEICTSLFTLENGEGKRNHSVSNGSMASWAGGQNSKLLSHPDFLNNEQGVLLRK